MAEDIKLQDGRVLRDASVIRQSELRVTIRHADGMTSVDKTQLPSTQRSQYPATPTVAEEEARRAAARSAKARLEEEERRRKLEAAEADQKAARARAAEQAKRMQEPRAQQSK